MILPLQDEIGHNVGKPLEIWNGFLFEKFSLSSFISVFEILSEFAHALHEFQSEYLMVVVQELILVKSKTFLVS